MDLDGLADAWELQHGLDPQSAADAVLDLDGDGLHALAEYQSGTDPWCADSNEDGLRDGASGDNPDSSTPLTTDTQNLCRLLLFQSPTS